MRCGIIGSSPILQTGAEEALPLCGRETMLDYEAALQEIHGKSNKQIEHLHTVIRIVCAQHVVEVGYALAISWLFTFPVLTYEASGTEAPRFGNSYGSPEGKDLMAIA